MQREWSLHVSRGLIEDGNPEFHVGGVFDWAVAFWSETVFSYSLTKEKTAVLTASNYYHINAEVIYISEDPSDQFCILDFGIMAESEMGMLIGMPIPHGCTKGDYVTGVIGLELPFSFAIQPYNIRYRWRVNQISADLADFSLYPGDLGKVDYLDVPGTDSVKAGSYVLLCSEPSSLI